MFVITQSVSCWLRPTCDSVLTLLRRITHLCVVGDFKLLIRENIAASFSSNSEADASELLGNIEEQITT